VETEIADDLKNFITNQQPRLTFDDVLIVPALSDIESRELIDTSVEFLGLTLSTPIISANMDYVTGYEMAKSMYENGGLGILHRFSHWDDQLKDMDRLDVGNIPFIFSVGIRNEVESFEKIQQVADSFPNAIAVCIDVAHGHHTKVAALTSRVKKETRLKVIAGNVATREGAEFLRDAGADAVKVGIGAGAVCTTRTVAGVGVPQLSAIVECSESLGIPTIADGGIRGSADIVKALIAGATTVMVGSLLAGTDECPSPVIVGSDGRNYRPYRGQSIFGSNGERYVKEGIEGYVEEKGPVSRILRNLRAGLQSGMSYVGAANTKQLREKGRFTLISANTQAENATRVRQVI
jgi:IMP dehydrogenase